MPKAYELRILLLAAVLAVISAAAVQIAAVVLPYYNWVGLAYLTLVTLLIHRFVKAAEGNANAHIRRLMLASIFRILAGVLFLLVTLLNTRPANVPFVIFYCSYFCVFMVFEISQMRTNLRPDLKPRPKNENA